ncbi:MAG: flagellar biosynthesis protein FliQ [Peptostreptococcaceae bacterium]|nr:flagellar biosynthesis protein FliQ [Peptostreptococcaceae bacterium]
MNMEAVISVIQEAVTMVLLLSAPMLLIGLLVGLLVSVFQATTQIQEATLAFVPKIVAVLLSIVIFGPWMISSLVHYTEELFMNINNFIR